MVSQLERPTRAETSAVGERHTRADAVDKVTGRAAYAGDIRLPRMLHAAMVKSPAGKGKIRSIDPSAALAMPGVRAVITADDLRRPPISCRDIRYGVVVRDRPILAEGRVTFVGEPVAAVVADDRATARLAATRVVVEIEEEEGAFDLDTALQPNSPLVHPEPFEVEDAVYKTPIPLTYGESNTGLTYEYGDGDVESALASAARVYESTYRFPAIYQYAMEPYCVVASVEANALTVWSSAQHPSQVARDLARLFDLPLSRVQVIVPYVGGGFGSKSFTHVEPLTVALAKAVGRPVRLELDVSEAMTISRRHNALATVRAGVDESGNIVAYDMDIAYDTGAYTLLGPYVIIKGAFRGLGAYSFPNYRVRARLVFTNTSPAGSMRAVGGPQAAFALESMLDEIAQDLGQSPFEFRCRMVAERGEEFRPGRTPMDGDLARDLETLEAMIGERPEPTDSKLVGVGVSMGITDPGASPVSTAFAKLAADGSLTVTIGSTEIGQGVRTVISQIAADTLGVPFESVSVTTTDTRYGPYDASTGASRSTTMSGLAVHRACGSIRQRLVTLAASEWGVDPDEVAISDGVVECARTGDGAGVGELIGRHFGQNGGNFIGVGEVTAHEFPTTPPFWEVAAAVAQVSVDPDTGQVATRRYYSVANVGKVVNPLLMEGQEEGAITQGLGHSLFEELEWSEGHPLNNSMIEYRVPRTRDVPPEMHAHFTEDGDGPGPFGLKGAGEGGIVPVGGAIANAVADAIGARVRELPLTPEKVWQAMRAASSTNEVSE